METMHGAEGRLIQRRKRKRTAQRPHWADNMPPLAAWFDFTVRISVPNVEEWARGRGVPAEQAQETLDRYVTEMHVGLQIQAAEDGVTFRGGGFSGSRVEPGASEAPSTDRDVEASAEGGRKQRGNRKLRPRRPPRAPELPGGEASFDFTVRISVPNVETWAKDRGIPAEQARQAFERYATEMHAGLQDQAAQDGVTYHGGALNVSPVEPRVRETTSAVRYVETPTEVLPDGSVVMHYGLLTKRHRWPLIRRPLFAAARWRNTRKNARTPWTESPIETNGPIVRAEMHFKFIVHHEQFAEAARIPVEQVPQAFAELMLETKREVLNKVFMKGGVTNFLGDDDILKLGTKLETL